MKAAWIELQSFRNYVAERAELSDGLNFIIGRNAQGKTNLLEGVHLLSGLGSPRGDNNVLVRDGDDVAFLHAEVTRGPRSLKVDMEIRRGRGVRILLNRSPAQRVKLLSESIVTVFFGPDELSLVKGSPEGRRRFLDDLLVKLAPAQDATRREFDRVLKQRNALLRGLRAEPAPDRSRADVWNDALARAGAALAAARLRTLADLIPFARKRYEEIAGAGRLEISYSASWLGEAAELLEDPARIDEEALRQGIRGRIRQLSHAEFERGVTLVGPQRDDVVVHLATDDGTMLDARSFASQGDQRTTALALKLAEHDLLSDRLDQQPVLLLDDVFSELDAYRRGWLADAVRSVGQTLVTAAEPVALSAMAPDNVVEVAAGRIGRP